MFAGFFKKTLKKSAQSSDRRKVKPQLESLENRNLISATGPIAGVLWTKEVNFHGHWDGSAAHMPKASDFKVEYYWGDGSKTTAKTVVELKPNSANFKAIASHTYTKAGNTTDFYKIDITNLRDPSYHWVQESRKLKVEPASTPSEMSPAKGMDLWDPRNPLNPFNILTLTQPAQAHPGELQSGQTSGQPKLQGEVKQQTTPSVPSVPVAPYLSAYTQKNGNPTPPPKGYVTPPPAKKDVAAPKPATQQADANETKRILTGAARDGIKNPSGNSINDPVTFRFGGTSNNSSLDNLQKALEKADKFTNWVPTVDALKSQIRKAVDLASAEMQRRYPGKPLPKTAIVANGTLTASPHGKFKLTIAVPETLTNDEWQWANLLIGATKYLRF